MAEKATGKNLVEKITLKNVTAKVTGKKWNVNGKDR